MHYALEQEILVNALPTRRRWTTYLTLLLCLATVAAGCSQSRMDEQRKYEFFEPSPFFEDGKSAREYVPNTVARGRLRTDTHLYEGTIEGRAADTFPFPITQAVLDRGQERYQIFCTPCHGNDGYGDGIVVQRGLTPPPSFHEERLRAVPHGHIFGVITNGIGAMYSYNYRIPPEDRWAIVAYVRALQLSQNATLEDVPAAEQGALEE